MISAWWTAHELELVATLAGIAGYLFGALHARRAYMRALRGH